MLLEFEKKVAVFLGTIEFPISKVNILLAVSGGADSIALLHALHTITSQDIFRFDLYCAHINHQLRDDADNDEEFVFSQAQKLNIPVITKRLDIRKYASDNKLSIETAARKLRIENLTEIAKTNKCNWIATGHQKNDNAETIIHRILRGTGFRGLAGIWPVRKFQDKISFIRPLLCVTREDIIQYLRQNNINWHEDYTNAEFIYTRNHIRHKLLPALQEKCKYSLVEQLTELSQKAESLHKQICIKADALWPEVSICNNDKIILKKNIISTQLQPVQLKLIRRALIALGSGERDLTSEHYERIMELIKQGYTGKTIQLPNRFNVHVEYQNIVFKLRRVGFAPPDSSNLNQFQSVEISISGSTTFKEFTIQTSIIEKEQVDLKNFLKSKTPETECFDFDKIKEPLFVRLRKDGDRFVPFGQNKEKKIGKFLTAQHVTEEARSKTLVITDSEKIIWLCPIRASEQTKVTSETRKILQLKLSQYK
ncbi:MAG: tRNA lysidine(34) synthetase TilS [Sedimentisphaerales bacterium]|nr:tRNA lysidine(34) synthetase TilS [Sedimentisphaerales bacterium]